MSNSAIRLSCRIPERKKKRRNSRNDVWPCFKSWKASTDSKNCVFALSSIDFKVDAYTNCFWSPAECRGHNRKTQFGKTTLEMNYIFITMRSLVRYVHVRRGMLFRIFFLEVLVEVERKNRQIGCLLRWTFTKRKKRFAHTRILTDRATDVITVWITINACTTSTKHLVALICSLSQSANSVQTDFAQCMLQISINRKATEW